jgi:glycerol uptake facilitator-like aquaporin
MTADVRRRLTAEAIGTALLLAAIVGSGIMADRLSGGNEALALLANTVATFAALVALILTTAPPACANSAVTLARSLTDTFAGIRPMDVPGFIVAQCAGALVATVLFRWLTPVLPAPTQYAVPSRSETSV